MTGKEVRLKWLSAVAVGSLIVAACGSPSGSATTSTTVSTAAADQTTTGATATPSTSQPTNPTTSSATTTTKSESTTTSQPTTTSSTKAVSTPTTTTAKPATTTTVPTTTTTVSSAQTISGSVISFGYNPNPITIQVGDTIRWTNDSGAPHTVTSSGNWDSGSLPSAASFSMRFDSPGTFNYFCTIHGAGVMSATVVVNS